MGLTVIAFVPSIVGRFVQLEQQRLVPIISAPAVVLSAYNAYRARAPFGLALSSALRSGSLEGFLQGQHGLIKPGGVNDAGQARDRRADRQDIDVGRSQR